MAEDYVRTPEELAHQARYEATEAKRHNVILVVYKLEDFRPDTEVSAAAARSTRAWVVLRRVNEETPTKSREFYRRVEAIEHIRQEERIDRLAAKRLGTAIHIMREGYA